MWYVGIIRAKDLEAIQEIVNDVQLKLFDEVHVGGQKHVVLLTQYSKNVPYIRRKIRESGVWLAYNGKFYE